MNIASATTALFVPGDRPERFEKATGSNADLVIIDLEDGVSSSTRAQARTHASAALTQAKPPSTPLLVRINGAESGEFDRDLELLREVVITPGHALAGVILAKAEKAEAVNAVAHALQHSQHPVPAIALIESARGVVSAFELARLPAVNRLAFGALDFALDIDADGSDVSLDLARSWLVIASRAAGIAPPLDSPTPELHHMDVVQASAQRARGLGFGGKLCIHPKQVPVVAEQFTPSDAEVTWARTVAEADGGATQIAGMMVDRPVVDRAIRILHRAGAGR